MRIVMVILALLAALGLGLLGAMLVLYGGDSPGADPYIRIAARDVDADAVGASLLLVAMLLLVAAIAGLRSARGGRQPISDR